MLACGGVKPAQVSKPTPSNEQASGPSASAPSPSAPAPSAPATPPPSTPSFALSFLQDTAQVSAARQVGNNTAVSIVVHVRRVHGFNAAVTLSVSKEGQAVSAVISPAANTTETEIKLVLPGSETATAGVRSYVIRAASGSINSEVTLTITTVIPSPTGPQVTSLSLVGGNAEREVKQGFADVRELDLLINGTNLDQVTSIQLRQDASTIHCAPNGTASSTEITCAFQAAHGRLGSYDLHFNDDSTSRGEAISVIPIAVSSTGSDDNVSPHTPFLTLDAAAGFAKSGDTITLEKDEQYSITGVPSGNKCETPRNLRGVTLNGYGAIISGGSLVLDQNTTLRDVTIAGVQVGLITKGTARVTLENVVFQGNSSTNDTAVYACGDSEVSHAGDYALVDGWIRGYIMLGSSTLQLGPGNEVRNNVTGVYLGDTASASIESVAFNNNTRVNALSITSGIYAAGASTLTLQQVSMTSNGGSYTNGGSADGGLVLHDQSDTRVLASIFDNSLFQASSVVLRGQADLNFEGASSNIYRHVNDVAYHDARDANIGTVFAPNLLFFEFNYNLLIDADTTLEPNVAANVRIEDTGNRLDLRD